MRETIRWTWPAVLIAAVGIVAVVILLKPYLDAGHNGNILMIGIVAIVALASGAGGYLLRMMLPSGKGDD